MLLLPNSYRGMGASRETMELQKQHNSPRPGPAVLQRKGAAKEQVMQRVRNMAVQNKMRAVLS